MFRGQQCGLPPAGGSSNDPRVLGPGESQGGSSTQHPRWWKQCPSVWSARLGTSGPSCLPARARLPRPVVADTAVLLRDGCSHLAPGLEAAFVCL